MQTVATAAGGEAARDSAQAELSGAAVTELSVLLFSEHEAFHRIKAARAARRFPRILDMLADGSLNLTTVKLLAAHLTSENQHELLAAADGKSRREVELVLAARFPQRDKSPSVCKLPASRTAIVSAATDAAPPLALAGPPPAGAAGPLAGAAVAGTSASAILPAIVPPAPRPAVLKPIAEDRHRISFTANAATYAQLQIANESVAPGPFLRHDSQLVERNG